MYVFISQVSDQGFYCLNQLPNLSKFTGVARRRLLENWICGKTHMKEDIHYSSKKIM